IPIALSLHQNLTNLNVTVKSCAKRSVNSTDESTMPLRKRKRMFNSCTSNTEFHSESSLTVAAISSTPVEPFPRLTSALQPLQKYINDFCLSITGTFEPRI